MNRDLSARIGHDFGDVADRLFAGLALGIEAFGRDRETGLDAKHESPKKRPNAIKEM